jgi:programmed cell death 6-interacting protein
MKPRFDAFTHKPTSQYSLAFEKASVIFNISAVLSCHATAQNRAEDNGLKTAYHSFQASAGMFTYINENFLHAPSQDLNRDTVKTLINITLAQAQESFLEKQIRDGKKSALLAKLAAQAHWLYGQAKEGLEGETPRLVFDPIWLKFIQIKTLQFESVSQYYQALTEDEGNLQGSAIARLGIGEKASKQAVQQAKAFPASPSSDSNLGSDTASNLQQITKRQLELIQEKQTSLVKDNDFIYHQTVPAEGSLQPVTKMPAAKAIPVSELYQGQDIQRIIGPDIFQKIVPMSVTEQASMYDEEKAKLIRSEAEKVEQANGEMAASLDYLKLPNSLNVLKGGLDQEMSLDPEFERWCSEIASNGSFSSTFDQLQREKAAVLESLAKSSKQLDMEESVCEKMRSKYGGEWTQQPSSRLTSTLRSDIKSYRDTVDEAASSDTQLFNTARQHENDFEEMRLAGERGEADVLYQQALLKSGYRSDRGAQNAENLLDEDYGEGGPSIAEQIAKVEEILRKLNLVKRERMQVLKDLKEKVHTDDISNILILNKKSIANQENQLFQSELEKFRSHQNRLISTVHKQSSLLKELTKTFSDLLQDKRVRSDQQKYEGIQKARSTVLHKYRRAHTAYEDLTQGLMRAQGFYSEMKDSVDSLEKNVETFVSNRRAEGAQLLNQIEQSKAGAAGGQAAAEQKRMQELMQRLSMDPSASSPTGQRPPTVPPQPPSANSHRSPAPQQTYPTANPDPRFTIPPREEPAPVFTNGYPSYAQPAQQPQVPSPVEHQQSHPYSQGAAAPLSTGYNPMAYPERNITSPMTAHPGHQGHGQPFSPITSPPPAQQHQSFFPPQQQHSQPAPAQQQQYQQLNFTSPTSQYPPNQQYQTLPRQSSFQSPPPQSHHQQHPSYHQTQHQQATYTQPPYGSQPQPSPSFQSPYSMPQNYVPPPPPPGPPGGGSTTQYGVPGQQLHQQQWASGPGGYAQYQQRQPGQSQSAGSGSAMMGSAGSGQQQQQGGSAGVGGGDPWAGLSAWK